MQANSSPAEPPEKPSYVIWKIPVEIPMKHHYTLIKMAQIQSLTIPNADKDVEQRELGFIAGVNTK